MHGPPDDGTTLDDWVLKPDRNGVIFSDVLKIDSIAPPKYLDIRLEPIWRREGAPTRSCPDEEWSVEMLWG
jgi:hypothetical protein